MSTVTYRIMALQARVGTAHTLPASGCKSSDLFIPTAVPVKWLEPRPYDWNMLVQTLVPNLS